MPICEVCNAYDNEPCRGMTSAVCPRVVGPRSKKPDGWSSEYYEIPEGAKELQDLIEHREMNFSIGNIFKACYRMGRKAGTDTLYDLKKIKWYVEREIKRVEAQKD